MAFKDLYVSQVPKNPIVIPPALTRPGARAFTRDLRFTPPLCDYSRSPSTWDLQFSSASQLGASTRMISFGLSSKLKKKEPSFKEFLASPAMRFSFKELSL